jgi:PAS domain-containing protein
VSVGAANFPGSAPQGVAYALDVSELKRIEVPLRTNEAKFRKLIECVPPIVFMNDDHLGHFNDNERWLDSTGLNMTPSQRCVWLDSVHADGRIPLPSRPGWNALCRRRPNPVLGR